MRLWGKVVSGMMFFIAAIFATVAFFLPGARRECLAAVVILMAVALFGVPALVKAFSSFTGDEEILANGVLGSATISSLEPTGWRYNRYYPIVKFRLRVQAGGEAYPVEIKQAVDTELLQRLAPGGVVAVRVGREDHKKVVIDLARARPSGERSRPRGAVGAALAAARAGTSPAPTHVGVAGATPPRRGPPLSVTSEDFARREGTGVPSPQPSPPGRGSRQIRSSLPRNGG